MSTRVLVTSLPKSGTHLLVSTFEKLDFRVEKARKKQGQAPFDRFAAIDGNLAIFCHYRASDKRIVDWVAANGFKVLVLIRDPRDVCLSYVDYIASGQPKDYVKADPTLQFQSRDKLLRAVIEGYDHNGIKIAPVRDRTEGWLQWTKRGGVLTRFELLVHVASGLQRAAFIKPFDVNVSTFTDALVASYGRGESLTFNKGTTQRWEREFSADDVKLWNANAVGVAARLGYPEIPVDFKPAVIRYQ